MEEEEYEEGKGTQTWKRRGCRVGEIKERCGRIGQRRAGDEERKGSVPERKGKGTRMKKR